MNTYHYTEDSYEQTILDLFKEMGYDYRYGSIPLPASWKVPYCDYAYTEVISAALQFSNKKLQQLDVYKRQA